ncbi:RpiB/LacA/LacB family sugar-phosphate isomerase [Patescibacteria group bacterium]|nr:RpiB/LacA/LacB family sugar-phosphate isomerase [Patescibacteria group bacterium]
MTIYLATDHAGFELKEALKSFLEERKFKTIDLGAFEYDADDDYPDCISKVAAEVSKDPANSRAIILGGSGQGEAMVANRLPHVRATVYYGGPEEIIRLSREHNDANVLSLGARFLSEKEAKQAVKMWLELDFSKGERHVRRIEKIDRLEVEGKPSE